MIDKKDQLKKEIKYLVQFGRAVLIAEVARKNPPKPEDKLGAPQSQEPNLKNVPLEQAYQAWYSQALPVIKQVMPERYTEFVELYILDKRRDIDYITYTISDYLHNLVTTRNGVRVDSYSAFISKFQKQIFILMSAQDRIDSILSNIQGTLQAELFDDELGAASELLKKGHIRAAGALGGVTLERHLATVTHNHNIKMTKKTPSIIDFNEELKKQGVYDVPDWRFIARLSDLRNLSVHPKEREPTKDEIEEMIQGVQKVLQTIF